MIEGTTCYERDEMLCEDPMCFRVGCTLRNTRLARSSTGTMKALADYVEHEQATGCDIKLGDAEAEIIVAVLRGVAQAGPKTIMDAAASAAEKVSSWSSAKQEYASRIVPQPTRGRDKGETDYLRKGIQDFLDGNYEDPRRHRPGPCKHGQFWYNGCVQCDENYFQQLLAAPQPASNAYPLADRISAAAEYLVQTVERKLWGGIRADGRAKDNGLEPFHYSQHSFSVNGNARQEDYRDVVREIARILSLSSTHGEGGK